MIKAVVSDFGGVVTLPLTEAFTRAHEEIDIPLDALRKAMALNAARYGEPTLFKLERGQMTEAGVHLRRSRPRSTRCSAARSTSTATASG